MDNLNQKLCWMLLGAVMAAPLTWWIASEMADTPSQPTQVDHQHSAFEATFEVPEHATAALHNSTELSALEQQVLLLQDELATAREQVRAASEPTSAVLKPNSSGNINHQLADIFRTETRDPVWADELELQLGDFLYTSDLSTYFSYASYGCKRHICQLSFTPRGEDVDTMQWQRLNDSLFNSAWIKYFKVSAAQQTARGMQVHFSTKSMRELATEY
ncbi:hypothetical protein [Pseudoalteromonas sp. OOF1S-7]|uniref:hypothetical protein n=1 Tax=Pseudoalteromonas sp. OOF1S-7 TaxID=2917757 RepID=UPI001EF41926|nr:hypothetical protein [Pseudoalteromonas sp. OOF1S-7]MCG7536222.1 hypothetical protein [Pseudoalteromonas sp. OOF1S-7]